METTVTLQPSWKKKDVKKYKKSLKKVYLKRSVSERRNKSADLIKTKSTDCTKIRLGYVSQVKLVIIIFEIDKIDKTVRIWKPDT